MRLPVAVLVFLLIAILEVTLLADIRVASVKPSFFLILVVYVALFWGRLPGMWFGFAAGIFLDLFAPQNMGLNSLLLTSTGFLIGSLAASLYRDKYISQILTLFFVSILESLLYFALSSGSPDRFLTFFGKYGILGALYTTAVGALVFFALHLARVRWKTS